MKTGFPWPEATRSVAAVSVNFDAESYDLLTTTPERLFGRFSYGRYGVRAGLPRLLDVLAKHGILATFFVTGNDANRHAQELRRVVAAGHEVASRGADMKRPQPDNELAWLRDGVEAVEQATGAKVLGYRSPDNELSPSTLHHLLELGLDYDATFQDDDTPYRFLLPAGTLAEIPSSYALSDGPAYSARHTHARLLQIWRDETRALLDVNGLIPLVLHLRGDFGSSRVARIAMLSEYFSEIQAEPGIKFMTYAALARWTLDVNSPAEPDPFTAHAATLENTIYRGDLAVKPL
ncbi:polysaccharide deacetylase family protein [Pollutimonas sp. H1-120]|uniref:polysaccharide deacetylase family protein n=1 Tax=Pollutimonas sp. H1-120 TaxID=3148824 RepID=UPI003B525144